MINKYYSQIHFSKNIRMFIISHQLCLHDFPECRDGQYRKQHLIVRNRFLASCWVKHQIMNNFLDIAYSFKAESHFAIWICLYNLHTGQKDKNGSYVLYFSFDLYKFTQTPVHEGCMLRESSCSRINRDKIILLTHITLQQCCLHAKLTNRVQQDKDSQNICSSQLEMGHALINSQSWGAPACNVILYSKFNFWTVLSLVSQLLIS